jgi:hypothetical protein
MMLGAAEPGGGLIVHVEPGAQLPEQLLLPPPPPPSVGPSLLHADSSATVSNTSAKVFRPM